MAGTPGKISLEQLQHLGRLARLDIVPEERQALLRDMEKIVQFVEKINELEIENVEPLIHLTAHPSEPRPDVPHTPLPKELVLRNAPRADSDYFRVPKVLEK
jgi:aspartyl-tRNA(Asn)/glutamyl-tRNA(Gln) amidotransferase subunit C